MPLGCVQSLFSCWQMSAQSSCKSTQDPVGGLAAVSGKVAAGVLEAVVVGVQIAAGGKG